MPTGGSIENASLDGREFGVPADNEANINTGGSSNETLPNGDGVTGRLIKTVTPWKIDGLQVVIDHSNADLEFLQALADQNVDFVVTVTLSDDTTYSGVGQIQGELTGSSQSATAALTLSGPGKLTS